MFFYLENLSDTIDDDIDYLNLRDLDIHFEEERLIKHLLKSCPEGEL